jgi:hypothetical protein
MAKVFISYRRDDSAGFAGRVHDRLAREFGRDLLFMDVDAIPLGVNFVKVLREEVAKCDVLLAVIGSAWLDVRDDRGSRRLDDPNDFVRIEVATALQRDIPVIPILLQGASAPRADQLPEDIKELALRNALDVRHSSFHNDVDKLVRELKAQSDRSGMQRTREVHGGTQAEQDRSRHGGVQSSQSVDGVRKNSAAGAGRQFNGAQSRSTVETTQRAHPGRTLAATRYPRLLFASVAGLANAAVPLFVFWADGPRRVWHLVAAGIGLACGLFAGASAWRFGVHKATAFSLVATLFGQISFAYSFFIPSAFYNRSPEIVFFFVLVPTAMTYAALLLTRWLAIGVSQDGRGPS